MGQEVSPVGRTRTSPKPGRARDEMTADFRVLPYVQKPGAPVETRASEDRRPGLNPA